MHSYWVPLYLCTQLIGETCDNVQYVLSSIWMILNSSLLSMEVNHTHLCENCITQTVHYHHRASKDDEADHIGEEMWVWIQTLGYVSNHIGSPANEYEQGQALAQSRIRVAWWRGCKWGLQNAMKVVSRILRKNNGFRGNVNTMLQTASQKFIQSTPSLTLIFSSV